MGWLRIVESINLYVSFAEYWLFCRALLQKRPIILSILLTKATPQPTLCLHRFAHIFLELSYIFTCIQKYSHVCVYMCVYINKYIYIHIYVYIYIYIYICVFVYIYIYTYMYLYIYIYIYTHVFVYIYIYIYDTSKSTIKYSQLYKRGKQYFKRHVSPGASHHVFLSSHIAQYTIFHS